ncbi:MAG: hypothetical protein ABI955_11280 [Nitrospirota bacterium]
MKPRGREPVYCSRNCRQRTYEVLKAAEHIPVRILKTDLAHHELQALIRREVHAYLSPFLGKLDALTQLHDVLKTMKWDDDSLA